MDPRRGLRRWIFRSQTDETPSALSTYTHLELHHDGGIVMAEQERAHDGGGGKHALTDELIVGFCVDLIRIIDSVNTTARHTGDALIKVQIITPPPTTPPTPLAILARQRVGPFVVGSPEQPTWSRDLRRPIPILAAIPHLETAHERLEAARLIASDIANQFGYEGEHLPWPEAATAD